MNSFFTKIFYCILMVFLFSETFAQTKFIAVATPSTAGKDEYITLSLTVANGNNIQNITPPNLKDFNVVSGPNTTSEQNTINGKTSQYVSWSYVLLAKKTGTIKIPPAIALVNGLTFKSNGINIVVSKNKSSRPAPNNLTNANMQSLLSGIDLYSEPQDQTVFSDYILRKGENIQKKVNDNMQLRLLINKSSCYVGEALLATYKLFTRLKSESNLSKNPSFNGFSVVEMLQPNDGGGFTIEKLNGKSYNVYTIRKAQLYPLQPGDIEVETATLDNKISFLKYSGSNGNNYNIDPNSLVTETVALSTKPTIINVKPLPDNGKPIGFNGAVGNFTIEATLQKKSIATDETAKLFVTITGSGNMHLLTLPNITWPLNFEVFDEKVSDNTDSKTVPVSGSKTFEIPFTVSKQGSYNIPSIKFSYFNPATVSYTNITTESIPFTIVKGKRKSLASIFGKEKQTNDKLSLGEHFINNRGIILLFVIGSIIAGLIFWMTKDRKERNKVLIKKNTTTATASTNDFYLHQNPLTKTEDCLFKNECVTFYSIINEEMKNFLAKRFNVTVEELNNKKLAIVMDRAGIGNGIILQTQELINEIEWQLYTPYERNEELNKMYAKAQNVVQLLIKQV